MRKLTHFLKAVYASRSELTTELHHVQLGVAGIVVGLLIGSLLIVLMSVAWTTASVQALYRRVFPQRPAAEWTPDEARRKVNSKLVASAAGVGYAVVSIAIGLWVFAAIGVAAAIASFQQARRYSREWHAARRVTT